MNKILVAVDEQIFGKMIADFVVHHEWTEDTEFKVLHVLEPTRDVDVWPDFKTIEADAQETNLLLKSVSTTIKAALPKHEVTEETTMGFAKEEILNVARQWGATVIIMGSHGRKGLNRILLGSVSETISANADCTVIVVRIPVGHPAHEPPAEHSSKSSETSRHLQQRTSQALFKG